MVLSMRVIVPKRVQQIIDCLCKVVTVLFLLFVVWILCKLFVYSTYTIPSYSMSPTLLPGDKILVDKTYMGARIFDIKSALERKPITITRTCGRRKLKVNDVVVFNYPYPQSRDSIGFDLKLYYVKRCLATPGDSLSIVDGLYYVNGREIVLPEMVKNVHNQLNRLFTVGEKHIPGVSIKAYPKKELNWTIVNFGPFYVPRSGDYIVLDYRHYLLYKTIVEWETKSKLQWINGCVYMNGRKLSIYRMTKNYYFMGGDNVFSSVDSRYWGLVPEDFIVGKVFAIYYSVDSEGNKIRWNRIGGVE